MINIIAKAFEKMCLMYVTIAIIKKWLGNPGAVVKVQIIQIYNTESNEESII
jgi:hypothetical protein